MEKAIHEGYHTGDPARRDPVDLCDFFYCRVGESSLTGVRCATVSRDVRAQRDVNLSNPDYSGFFSTRLSSPITPRRNVSTHTTKMIPCTTVTRAPSWAR